MTSPRSARRMGPLLVALAVAVAVVAAGAGGLWYLFLRPAGPPPVSLASLPPAAPGSTDGASSVDPGASAGGGQAVADGDISGTWTVDPSVGTLDDASGTFVGYRVQEQLASVGASEAVGRTSSVTGSITIEGTTVTAAEFTADLTTLRSDDSNRDRQLSRQALQTAQFPSASFTLAQPIALGSVPADGAVAEVTATGELTLHGVTRSVEIPLQARLHAGVISVAGSLPITFADWSIQPPQAMIVLSVDDHGTMELQLQLRRS
jgi:polyisoprenoid-binding protein YceI